jgi:hypothetical protein
MDFLHLANRHWSTNNAYERTTKNQNTNWGKKFNIRGNAEDKINIKPKLTIFPMMNHQLLFLFEYRNVH